MTSKIDIYQAITYTEALFDELPGSPEIHPIPDLLQIDSQTEIESTILERKIQ